MAWRKSLTRMETIARGLANRDQTSVISKAITLGEKTNRDEKSSHLRALRLERDRLTGKIP
jgi:hypothetical protein